MTTAVHAISTWARACPGESELASPDPDRARPVSTVEVNGMASLVETLDVDCDSLYAECRLGSARQLDLLLSFGRGSPNISPLCSRLAERSAHASPQARAAWRSAQSFFEHWTDSRDPLFDAVSVVWLEFDDVLRTYDAVAPSLSACVVPRYGRAGDVFASPRGKDLEDVLCFVGSRMLGDLDANLFERIGRVVAALPEAGRYIHISWMAARPSMAVKLYGSVPRGELSAYLQRIGFAGPVDFIREVMAKIATPDICGQDIYFDLNLSNMWDSAAASLGIAFSQQQALSVARRDAARRSVLERLLARGYCTASQARALTEWVEPLEGKRRVQSREPSAHRWLDLKLVLSTESGGAAKGYLGFGTIGAPLTLGWRCRAQA